MRIVVVGARGQLGTAILRAFEARHDVVPFGRDALDVADDRAVAAAMARVRPDAIINCAAYNDVDSAEDHPVDALNANAFAVRALARAAAEHGATLVHYSTDFVFDGTATAPYTEADPPNPKSTYAASKLLGEWFAADAPRAYVLRVESLFGRAEGGGPSKGSVASIVKTLLAGVQMTISQQLVMMLTLMLASKGVAGVPRAALVVLTATLTQFDLPLEGAAVLLGIDQIMDMGRTAVNVMGNCMATVVVARWEGVLERPA